MVLVTGEGIVAWLLKTFWSREWKAKEAEITTLKAEVASLKTSNETLKEQKEAQIDGLKQQIQLLQEMTPTKMRESYLSMKDQLEEFVGRLQEQLEVTQAELQRERTIGRLNEGRIRELEAEKERLAGTSRSAERLLGNLAAQVHNFAPITEMPEAQEGGTAIADWVSWLLDQERGGLAFGNSGSANHAELHFNTRDGKRSRLTIRAISRSGSPALEVRCGGDCPPGWGKPRQGIAHLLPPLV